MTPQEAYQNLFKHYRETAIFSSMGAVLGWDQRVMMPPKGASHRAEQMAALAGLVHSRSTDPRIGEWLSLVENSDLVAEPRNVEAVNVRWWRWGYDRITKIPQELAIEIARTTTLAQKEWEQARADSDYSRFKPWLSRILDLERQVADALGYEEEPYDALLENYEPGMRARQIETLFAPLRAQIPLLVQKIIESPRKPDSSILYRHYPRERQEQFIKTVLAKLGYDFEAGRLDPTVHPFETSIGPGDVRITTRYYEDYFGAAFFGSVHETGHALYELGLPAEHYGTPMGDSVSLGIHESQSRMWENFVGRSLAFWEHFYPQAQAVFEALQKVPLEAFHFAINEVKPSTIRVEADEVTYNLHILLRFELELALMRGDLSVEDLPGAWNERFKNYLGFEPPNDAEGVLQDVHWSGGMIGYFPTYTLGNLYAAQFFEQANRDLGDLQAQFRRGEFMPLLEWLREKIHRHGMRYTATELAEVITGKPLSAQPLLNYLQEKFGQLYNV